MSERIQPKLVDELVTITGQFDFGSGTDPDLAYQWETKCKLFSLAKVCALPLQSVFYVLVKCSLGLVA